MERSNLDRLEALVDAGHDCHLVSLNAFGKLLPLLEKSRISHESLDYAADKFKTFVGLCRLIRSDAHDGVICTGHNLLATLALPSRNRSHQILCVHFHHAGVKPPLFWKVYYRLAMTRFSHIFFNSSFIRDEALALVPSLRRLSSVLPNIYKMQVPVDSGVRLQARRELGLPEDTPIISNAGWLIPRKRFDIFLMTAAVLCQKNPEVRFLIAGDGSEREKLQRLAEDKGIADRIHWLGWCEDMAAVYAASDVVLFNTDWDAVARTPIEAGISGVNVVCSELNGGLRDLFDHPPWILSDHDINRLAELLEFYLSSKKECEEQIVGIREIILSKCSPKAHLEQILDVLVSP